MALIDCRQLPDGAELAADVCIVGAGAAGLTLAAELERFPGRICVIESGGYDADETVQSLYDLDNVGYPIRENFMSRARYFGGSCNLWAGRAMKLHPIDFAPREWVPDSGWPVSYEELELWLEKAEAVLRLPAFTDYERPGALPDMDEREQALFDGDELRKSIALWAVKPLRFGRRYRKTLRRSRTTDVYLHGNVVEIMANDARNAVHGLLVKTLTGKQLTARAKVYVLAAGGLENARLLLASRQAHPNGLGNGHDNVGRYYLDHPRIVFGSVRLNKPIRLPYLLGLALSAGKVQLGVALSEKLQRQERVLNSYLTLQPQLSGFAEAQYGRTVNVLKVLLRRGHAGGRFELRGTMNEVRDLIYLLTPKEIMPHAVYRCYAALKRLARRTVSASHLTVINFCEQPPRRESRVSLGGATDRLGMPRLELDWRVGEEEMLSLTRLHAVIARRLVETRIGVLEQSFTSAEPPPFIDASHHIGTARMSDDPRSGVVDRDCKVHGLNNLFIAGSAVFPTAGHANPTLTIVALALRLASHLQSRLRR